MPGPCPVRGMGQAAPARYGAWARHINIYIYIYIRHSFGHQSGPEQSSRKKSAANLRRIAVRFYLVFSKIDEKC